MADAVTQRAADQMAVTMARRMARARKIQAGLNSPLAEAAVLLAGRLAAPRGPTLYSVAISSTHFEPRETSLFKREWDVVAMGSTFPVEAVIDLMGGWEGIDDEPVRPIQVDRFGNINLSGIAGNPGKPGRRLMGPGPAGVDVLPNMASGPSDTLYTTQHSRRTLPASLSMTTAYSGIGGGDDRLRSGLGPGGFRVLVTDLCLFEFTPDGAVVKALHPWVDAQEVIDKTGWPVEIPAEVVRHEPPSARELELLDLVDPNNLRVIEFFGNEDRFEQALATWRRESAAGDGT